MNEPLPCPFCGHEQSLCMEIDDGSYCRVCEACSGAGPCEIEGRQSKETATARWNARFVSTEATDERAH